MFVGNKKHPSFKKAKITFKYIILIYNSSLSSAVLSSAVFGQNLSKRKKVKTSVND